MLLMLEILVVPVFGSLAAFVLFGLVLLLFLVV